MTTTADPARVMMPDAAGVPDDGRPIRLDHSRRVAGLALAAGLVAVPLLAACGSASHASAATSATTLSQTCTTVSGTLADGPDPDADPVGYAEAQITPLRQIKTADPALRTAVAVLADAYAKVFASKDKSQTAVQAVAAASKKVNAICPGAAS
jgi:hypothetical protein